MNINLDLSDDQLEYLEEFNVATVVGEALKAVAAEKPVDPLLVLSELLSNANGLERTLVEGYPVHCCTSVELGVGPVVGEVTHDKVQ